MPNRALVSANDAGFEPATEPIPIKTDMTLAIISYMNWWGTGKRYFNWPPATDPTLGPYSPLLGEYYNNGDPATIDWHIKWAVEHGITVFFFLCDMPTPGSDRVFDDGWMRSKYIDRVRFSRAIYLTDGLEMNRTVWMARLSEALERWSTVYFSHPSYFKIGSRPVIQVGGVDGALAKRGPEFVDEALRLVREIPRKYGYDPFVLGNGAWALSADSSMGVEVPLLKTRYGKFDALYNNDFDWNYAKFSNKDSVGCGQESYQDYSLDQVKSARVLSALASRVGKPFVPTVMPGLNPENLYLTHWYDWCLKLTNNTLPLFKSMIEGVKPYADKNLKLIFINSWNEWTEAHAIEPTKDYGFNYLDAIRETFATSPLSDWPPDIAPTGQGHYVEYRSDGTISTDTPINTAWSTLASAANITDSISRNATSPIFKNPEANRLFNVAAKQYQMALDAFYKNEFGDVASLVAVATRSMNAAYEAEQQYPSKTTSPVSTGLIHTPNNAIQDPAFFVAAAIAIILTTVVLRLRARKKEKAKGNEPC